MPQFGMQLASDGYEKIVLDAGDHRGNTTILRNMLDELGRSIQVFRRQPFWKELTVDLTRPLGKSSGVGFNSLHIDCVNVEEPPDYVVLYCVRPDPAGGGINIVAPAAEAFDSLAPAARSRLSQKRFSEGIPYDLDNVGEALDPFAVYSEGSHRYRYSGRLFESTNLDPGDLGALVELQSALLHQMVTVLLNPGEALFVDQRRVLHGRLPLGPQRGIPNGQRRLLVQAYGRARSV